MSKKCIGVTGGDGCLGRHVVTALKHRGYSNVLVPLIDRYDLTQEQSVRQYYADARPDIAIQLAAAVGGIGANRGLSWAFCLRQSLMKASFLLNLPVDVKETVAHFTPERQSLGESRPHRRRLTRVN